VVPIVDRQLPVIISGVSTPSTLEVCQTLKEVSVKASDNVGIAGLNMRILWNSQEVYSTFMYKTSGTNLSGTWANDWAIPCSANIGKYSVSVQAFDAAGNKSPSTVIPGFSVTPTTTQDRSAPKVISGSVSAGPIIVGGNIAESLARVSDDVGVKSVTFILVDPRGYTVAEYQGYRRSGTKLDGVYTNDWQTNSGYLAGQYLVYVKAFDEWQKTNGLTLIGKIDINPVPAPAPVPTPPSAITNETMIVRPYLASSAVRNASLSSAATAKIKVGSASTFIASTLYANGQNSGLLSLGHLLEVSTLTPAVCSVTGVATLDRTGGIYTTATVNGLTAGTCSVLWKFNGYKGRLPTSTTMNVVVIN
jgi:hypothetical protein